jgi:hypothetical protein
LEDEVGIGDSTVATPFYNDNKGAVDWSRTARITKKLRHTNIQELRVREAIEHKEIDMLWIPGNINPSDILTKEPRDVDAYEYSRDIVVCPRSKMCESRSHAMMGGVRTECDIMGVPVNSHI